MTAQLRSLASPGVGWIAGEVRENTEAVLSSFFQGETSSDLSHITDNGILTQCPWEIQGRLRINCVFTFYICEQSSVLWCFIFIKWADDGTDAMKVPDVQYSLSEAGLFQFL